MSARWRDLVDPDREELQEALGIEVDPEVLETLLAAPAVRPRARLEGKGGYVVGVFVAMSPLPEENRIEGREIAFVASSEQLVTVRKTPPGGEAWAPDCLDAAGDAAVGELVFRLADDVAGTYLEVVDYADAEIDELEDHIEDWPSSRVRRRISDLRHDLIHARRTVGAMRAKVRRITDKSLDIDDEGLFPENVERDFADTYETLFRAGEELDIARDLLASSRDFHQSLIAENQNEVVKILTVIASLVLVPSLVVGFYGQNFVGQFKEPYWTFGVSLGLIVGSTVLQLVLFRWRRWI
jgi:Mg2+ and Co2+ transporter CorA